MPVDARNSTLGYAAPRNPPNMGQLVLNLDAFNIDGTSNSTLADDFPAVTWKNRGTALATLDHVQATAGSKPVFVNGRNPAGINGHPSMLFTAAKIMTCAASPFVAQAARHIFVVSRILAARTGYYYIPRSTPVGAYALFGIGADSNIVEWNNIDAITTIGAAPAQSDMAIIEYTFDGVTSNVMGMKINGVAQVVTNPPGTENATAGSIVGQGFPGPIGQILGYNAVQSAAVAAEARDFLLERWSRSGAAPATGPQFYCLEWGDSLTVGLNDETSFGGYRGPLAQKLPRMVTVGPLSDSVGNYQAVSGTNTIVQLAAAPALLASIPFLDAVCLNLGTNFAEADDNASAANMVAIIRLIFARFPACVVCVMRIGIYGEASLLTRAAVLLAALGVAFPGDPRIVWVNPTVLTQDNDFWSGNGVHANHGGYLVQANFWAQALISKGFGP